MSKRKPPGPPKPPKPPKRDTRFKPGVSGNPKGRPRKVSASAQIDEIVQDALDEVVGHRDGKPVAGLRAMVVKTRNRIIEQGRFSEFVRFIEFCERRGLLKPPKDEAQEQKYGVLVVRQPCETAEEWERIYGEPAREAMSRGVTGRSSDDDEAEA